MEFAYLRRIGQAASMRPDLSIAACLVSHRRLLDDIQPLTDEAIRLPSGLPRWSRGRVLAHLINKADAHIWLFGGPPAGEVRRLYPQGYDPDVAANAGAGRAASELCSE